MFPPREFPATKLQLTLLSETATNKYYEIVGAENKLNNDNSKAPATAFTEAEQEQLCNSLESVGSPL